MLKRSSYLEARFSAANPYSTWVGPVTTNASIAVLKVLAKWGVTPARSQFELFPAATSIRVPVLLAFLGLRGKRNRSLNITLQLMSSSSISPAVVVMNVWHNLTEDVRGPLFFFSAFSRSSNSMFSRSMSVMSVLHLLWSSCGYINTYTEQC